MRKRGRLLNQSFHFSNVGGIDGFDAGDVRIEAVLPSLSHPGLVVGVLGFRGHVQMILGFPRSAIPDAAMRELLADVDDSLAELVATAPAHAEVMR
jgi:hypothetical protein